MLYTLAVAAAAFMAPAPLASKMAASQIMMGGKGFGGGEATRDPAPTEVDPNDPKGKQQAIHKAESFAEYLAKRKAEGGGEGGKGFGGGEATRDPAPTEVDPNDPKAKQTAIHKAESFADYLAKRSGGGGGAAPA